MVVLDGTWSQAKALWWRNAWMLKCQRVILGPAQPSRYGKLRKRAARRRPVDDRGGGDVACRPREAAGDRDDTERTFERMLAKYREVQDTMPELAPKPKKKDYRRRKRA